MKPALSHWVFPLIIIKLHIFDISNRCRNALQRRRFIPRQSTPSHQMRYTFIDWYPTVFTTIDQWRESRWKNDVCIVGSWRCCDKVELLTVITKPTGVARLVFRAFRLIGSHVFQQSSSLAARVQLSQQQVRRCVPAVQHQTSLQHGHRVLGPVHQPASQITRG